MDNADISIIESLRKIPIFVGLNDGDLELIVRRIEREVLSANSPVFKQGDYGNKMYIIEKGEVKVLEEKRGDPGEGSEIAVLGAGDFFGEMALISAVPRNATCVTSLETVVFSLKREDYEVILAEHQDMAGRIKKEYLKRQSENKHREQSIGDENLF
ncbi:cyclic nucleotide-binding domain-containing protein [Patescibacteria group bacterium]|nr:cyclic nucleotide-binding domain-containing protein [Patescibacteria group bacterium]